MTDERLHQLSELVRRCTGPGSSKFYRQLYGLRTTDAALEIRSWEEWHSLPTFSKHELAATPLAERVFATWSRQGTIVVSSGTSGKAPVFSPCSMNDGYSFRDRYHDFGRPVLASIPPVVKKEWELRTRHPQVVVIAHDPKNVRGSVELAKRVNADSLILFVFHVPAVAKEMIERGMNGTIRYIEIAGEPCPRSYYEYMRRSFPNATIVSEYGSSDVETDPIGVPCRPLGGDPLELFHPNERSYIELMETNTGNIIEPTESAEGEVLLTTDAGEDAAFPLIRYRIGDTIRVIDAQCKEHGTWSFQVLGRTAVDFLKVPGGVLQAAEVARVISRYDGKVSDDFEMHVEDLLDVGIPKIRCTLHVDGPGTADIEAFREAIARELRLAPRYSLHQAILEGHFLPLELRPLAPDRSGKRKRIIRD